MTVKRESSRGSYIITERNGKVPGCASADRLEILEKPGG
jgi:hypothetical protein